jgi:polysaccharide export outer membrane protein
MRISYRRLPFLAFSFLAAMVFSASASADEYIIGPEDVLQISFWQEPTLDQTVMVRQDGKITLSIIGEITAAGLTSKELAGKIVKDVSLYNKKISQATVTVIGFNSQKVYVSGQVFSPGKFTFEVIPDLWTIIKEAGGATEQGDLTRVTIIRSREAGGEVIMVNVLEAVRSGNLDQLPKLQSGDTVEVPKTAGDVPGHQLATDYTDQKNLFYVLGQARVPGQHPYEGETDIFDAIGAAGGLTELANPAKISIITKSSEGTTVIKVDLKEYQNEGKARRILIKPEDTIIIGEKSRPFLSWQMLRDVGAIAGAVTTVILLIDRLNND